MSVTRTHSSLSLVLYFHDDAMSAFFGVHQQGH